MNRDLLRAEVIRDEGAKRTPSGMHEAYKDTLGHWTIGYGHLLGDNPSWAGYQITEAKAILYLDNDLLSAETLARLLVADFDKLPELAQRALVNMSYNRGGHLRTSSKILPAILHASKVGTPEAWAAVRAAIVGSQWASQVGKRADRLADMFDPQHPQDEGFA